jgi:hypothetical protein
MVGTAAVTARAYAIVTFAYAGGFALPTVPVAVYLRQRGSLPWFGDLFPMYGGPWSSRLTDSQFIALLLGYLGVMAAVAGSARQVGRGSRRGALASLGLLLVEAVFWVGFALPIPWVLGTARLALLVPAWRRLPSPQLISTKEEISHA